MFSGLGLLNIKLSQEALQEMLQLIYADMHRIDQGYQASGMQKSQMGASVLLTTMYIGLPYNFALLHDMLQLHVCSHSQV